MAVAAEATDTIRIGCRVLCSTTICRPCWPRSWPPSTLVRRAPGDRARCRLDRGGVPGHGRPLGPARRPPAAPRGGHRPARGPLRRRADRYRRDARAGERLQGGPGPRTDRPAPAVHDRRRVRAHLAAGRSAGGHRQPQLRQPFGPIGAEGIGRPRRRTPPTGRSAGSGRVPASASTASNWRSRPTSPWSASTRRQPGAAVGALGLPPEKLADHPHVLAGSVGEICDQLEARRERYGVSYVTVGARGLEDFAPVVAPAWPAPEEHVAPTPGSAGAARVTCRPAARPPAPPPRWRPAGRRRS